MSALTELEVAYGFKQALEKLESKQRLHRVEEHVSLEDVPRRIIRSDKATLFQTTGTNYRVASNVCTRENFCAIFEETFFVVVGYRSAHTQNYSSNSSPVRERIA